MNFNNRLSQPNRNSVRPPLQPLGARSAFLLGRGPLPPPTGPEIAAAAAMRAINCQDGPPLIADENIDPQLRGAAQEEGEYILIVKHYIYPFILPSVAPVRVRIPVNDKVDCDIDFPVDIPCCDFLDRIFATMGLDPRTAKLGWKTNDEGKRAQAHELETDEQIHKAFNTIADLQKSKRHQKEVYMLIVHLVSLSYTSIFLSNCPKEPISPRSDQEEGR